MRSGPRHALVSCLYYISHVKPLTVRLPEVLVAEIEAESRRRGHSKSDVVRERLAFRPGSHQVASTFSAIADLVGSVDGLPEDLSGRTKQALRTTGYGKKRPR